MKQLFIFILLVGTYAPAFSQEASTRQKQFNINAKQIGIKGYDPVAYFAVGKAKEGNSAFSHYYAGVTYYFVDAANKELFKKNPAQYEPQYGGWCAYAMGNDGTKVEVDPETFKVINNKLYLFYNKYFTNTLKSWNKNEPTLMKNADANWLKFYH